LFLQQIMQVGLDILNKYPYINKIYGNNLIACFFYIHANHIFYVTLKISQDLKNQWKKLESKSSGKCEMPTCSDEDYEGTNVKIEFVLSIAKIITSIKQVELFLFDRNRLSLFSERKHQILKTRSVFNLLLFRTSFVRKLGLRLWRLFPQN